MQETAVGRRLPAIPVAEVVVVRHPFAGMNEVKSQSPGHQ